MLDLRSTRDEIEELDRAISAAMGERPLFPAGDTLDRSLTATVELIACAAPVHVDRTFANRLASQLVRPAPRSGNSSLGRRRWRVDTAARAELTAPAPTRLWAPRGQTRLLANLSLLLLLVVISVGVWRTMLLTPADTSPNEVEVSVMVRHAFPSFQPATVSLRRIRIEPGKFFITAGYGASLILVEKGTVDVGGLSLVEMTRMRSGETAYLDHTRGQTFGNSSTGTAEVLLALLDRFGTQPDPNTGQLSKGVSVDWLAFGSFDESMPLGATLRLRQLTMAPDEQFSSETTKGLSWVIAGGGPVEIALEGAYLPFGFEAGLPRTLLADDPLGLAPGVSAVGWNRGGQPITVLALTVEPVSESDPPP